MTALLALFFFLLPTYLIRFHIGSVPTTLLEVFFWIIVVVFIFKNKKNLLSPFSFLLSQQKSLFIAIAIFLTAATIAVFTSLNTRAALGEWKAFYVEPIIMFFLLITTIKTQKQISTILLALISLSLITSALAIYQHFTGWLVPDAFWANRNTYRVTAWYGFPNAVGLFLAPLVPLVLYVFGDRRSEIGDKQKMISNLISLISIPLILLAILFAKSTGGLLGVAAGIGTLLLLNKKMRAPALMIAVVALAAIFLLPPDHAMRQELFAQNRSGQIRVAMWGEATKMLSERPILGAGLASYAERVKPYHTTVDGEGIEIFHHPHNIFLTMWVNLGLLGLVGFLWILWWFYRIGLQNTPNASRYTLNAYLVASMTTLLVTGLVDSPYIKNDLAIFFWLLPALMIVINKKTATAS